MINRIVIALDGSHRAELAVPYATYLGAMLGAQVELITATEKDIGTVGELDDSVQRSIAEAEGFMSTWIRDVDTNLVKGKPVEAIVEYAGNTETLIAMATHGRTGLTRRLAGSVAEGILRATKSPVLITRSNENAANIRFAARVTQLLVPVDGTEVAAGALPTARLFAEKLNANVTILHVGEEGGEQKIVDEASGHFTGLKSEVETSLASGDPGREIVRQSGTMGDALIVMCSKKANVATGPIRGSVTDYVIRHANRPVLVVPYSTVESS